jgi:hypothetical protein
MLPKRLVIPLCSHFVVLHIYQFVRKLHEVIAASNIWNFNNEDIYLCLDSLLLLVHNTYCPVTGLLANYIMQIVCMASNTWNSKRA